MANECIPLFTEGDQVTFLASAAVTGKKFVDISAAADASTGVLRVAPPAAAGKVTGVAAFDAAQGGLVTVLRDRGSVVPVTAGGSVAFGAEVQVDATGAVVTLASGVAVGRAWSAGSAGNDVFVTLY